MLSRVILIGLAMTSVAAAQPAKTPPGARTLCRDYPWACSAERRGKVEGASDILDLAKTVNREINSRVRPASDRSQYGSAERWTLPDGAGDCEDYALAKKQALIRAGVAPGRLRLAQVMKRGVPSHVVLIVETGGGDYVLDSLTGRVEERSSSSYVFLKQQNGAGWETGIQPRL